MRGGPAAFSRNERSTVCADVHSCVQNVAHIPSDGLVCLNAIYHDGYADASIKHTPVKTN